MCAGLLYAQLLKIISHNTTFPSELEEQVKSSVLRNNSRAVNGAV